jgi:rubrerythrin
VSDDALLTFLAYSRELERESGERYSELAATMAMHHNRDVAEFFEEMARQAGEHLSEVLQISAGRDLPALEPWDFHWPADEPPESTSYEALHYRMSLHEAMTLALGNEKAAERFYRQYGEGSEDAQVQRLAAQFAEEEAGHARALERLVTTASDPRDHAREDDDPPHMPE